MTDRIVVLDADERTLETRCRALKATGRSLEVHTSPEAAWASLDRDPPAVVVLNAGTPGPLGEPLAADVLRHFGGRTGLVVYERCDDVGPWQEEGRLVERLPRGEDDPGATPGSRGPLVGKRCTSGASRTTIRRWSRMKVGGSPPRGAELHPGKCVEPGQRRRRSARRTWTGGVRQSVRGGTAAAARRRRSASALGGRTRRGFGAGPIRPDCARSGALPARARNASRWATTGSPKCGPRGSSEWRTSTTAST